MLTDQGNLKQGDLKKDATTKAETMSASVVVIEFRGPQCCCQFQEVLDVVVMQKQELSWQLKWKEVRLLLIEVDHMLS